MEAGGTDAERVVEAAAWRRTRHRHVWAAVAINTTSVSMMLAGALALGGSARGGSGASLNQLALWLVGTVCLIALVEGVVVALWGRLSMPAALTVRITTGLCALGAGAWVDMTAVEPVVVMPVAVPVGLLAVGLASRMIWSHGIRLFGGVVQCSCGHGGP